MKKQIKQIKWRILFSVMILMNITQIYAGTLINTTTPWIANTNGTIVSNSDGSVTMTRPNEAGYKFLFVRLSQTGRGAALKRDLIAGEKITVKIRAKSSSTKSWIMSKFLDFPLAHFTKANEYQDFSFETTVKSNISSYAWLGLFTNKAGDTVTVKSIEILDGDTPPETKLKTWYNTSIVEQTGSLEATFTATPSAENIDSVMGFSNTQADAYTDLGMIVRFSPSGNIDARNGDSYNATTSINYVANKVYTFRLIIDFNTKKYSIYVTAEGEDEVLIGENYNFRTEQSSLSSITSMAHYSTANGVVSVSEVTFTDVDTTPPVITLNGANPLNLKVGEIYTDPRATATDDVDGDLDVTITGSVNRNTSGTYIITYFATDLAGNSAIKKRTVNVLGGHAVDYGLNNDTDHESIQLRIPNKIKVVQGKDLKIYFDNIVNVENVQLLNFKFILNGTEQDNYQGIEGENRYIQIAIPEGRSKLSVEVMHNGVTASANSEILSFNQNTSIQDAKVLVIGDSFTDGSDYLIPLHTRLESQWNHFSFIGTRKNQVIPNEGYAGWEAQNFLSPKGKWQEVDSPFFNSSVNQIDFSNYFENKLKDTPDIVVIQLGVNDVVSVTKGIQKGYYTIENVSEKVNDLERLVNEIKQSLPNVKVLVMEPTPPNKQMLELSGMDMNDYRNMLQVYWEKSLNKFENRENENIYVVPGFVDIDPWNGFRDAVHPNASGYGQLAQTLMSNLLWTVVQNKNAITSKENNIVDDTPPSASLGKKIFEIDFNQHSTGTYTTAMHKQDFYTYQGEDLYYKKNHDGSWMYGTDGLNNTSIIDDNNEKVLRVQYNKGRIHPTNGFQSLAALPKNNRPVEDVNNPQEVTLVYSVKFENGFEWVIGGKLPGLAGGLARAGGQNIGNYNMKNGFTARFMWHMLETASGSKVPSMLSYIYHPGRAGTNGQFVYGSGPYMSTEKPTLSFIDHSNDALFQFKTNKWYKIRQTIKANRPYKSDGTMKVWINDKLASSFGNMKFIADGMHEKYSVDRFLFSTFYGGGGPEYAPKIDTHALFKGIKVYVK